MILAFIFISKQAKYHKVLAYRFLIFFSDYYTFEISQNNSMLCLLLKVSSRVLYLHYSATNFSHHSDTRLVFVRMH